MGGRAALYEPNGFRSSDHDPTVVGIHLIHYNFSGFLPPVVNSPALNVGKAGSSIPVKFTLGGFQGLDIFLADRTSGRIACSGTASTVDVEPIVTAGDSVLSYDATSDQYSYVWKTNKAWRNTCRQLVIVLKDGTVHSTDFFFQ